MNIPIKTVPTHKDETDMELGLDFAVELGADDIVIFGGIGSRFDHTLANAHLLLRLLKKGVRARLVDEKNCVELINNSIVLEGQQGDLVSTIPLFYGSNWYYIGRICLSINRPYFDNR